MFRSGCRKNVFPFRFGDLRREPNQAFTLPDNIRPLFLPMREAPLGTEQGKKQDLGKDQRGEGGQSDLRTEILGPSNAHGNTATSQARL